MRPVSRWLLACSASLPSSSMDHLSLVMGGELIEDVPQFVELKERSRCQATFSL